MTTKHRIHWETVFKAALCISLLISGICLMVGCVSIYRSGADQPYTREAVAQAFKKIEIPVYISLALIVITSVGAVLAPNDRKKAISTPSAAQLLKLFSEKRDISGITELAEKASSEQRTRRIHTVIWGVINAVSAVSFLIYALNSSNFDRSDINGSMIKAMLVLLPCLALSFASSLLFCFLNQRSRQRELELWKKAPLKDTSDSVAEETDLLRHSRKEKNLKIVRLVLLAVFLCFAIYGFITGGTADVLTKAVNICTECIGLG